MQSGAIYKYMWKERQVSISTPLEAFAAPVFFVFAFVFLIKFECLFFFSFSCVKKIKDK